MWIQVTEGDSVEGIMPPEEESAAQTQNEHQSDCFLTSPLQARLPIHHLCLRLVHTASFLLMSKMACATPPRDLNNAQRQQREPQKRISIAGKEAKEGEMEVPWRREQLGWG